MEGTHARLVLLLSDAESALAGHAKGVCLFPCEVHLWCISTHSPLVVLLLDAGPAPEARSEGGGLYHGGAGRIAVGQERNHRGPARQGQGWHLCVRQRHSPRNPGETLSGTCFLFSTVLIQYSIIVMTMAVLLQHRKARGNVSADSAS